VKKKIIMQENYIKSNMKMTRRKNNNNILIHQFLHMRVFILFSLVIISFTSLHITFKFLNLHYSYCLTF